MKKMRTCLGVVLGALGTWMFAILIASGAPAQDAASLMIVVDGSGSMAGLMEPKARAAKINLVRDALRPALATISPQTKIGLVAFGHRTGNCKDAEIIRAPEPPDVEPMMAALALIKPKGKGPLTFGLREAAKQLPEKNAQRSLVLIHDGADNCEQDVCAAATELGAARITAHVVSLGVAADELAKMACLPQATGGRHFKVETSEQVAAAIGEAVRVASNDLAAVAVATTAPLPSPAAGPSALHLRALLAPATEPLSTPLRWKVHLEGEPDTLVFDAWAVNPVVPVVPGQYVVSVRGELVAASQIVTVRENRPVAVPIVLGAGAARVRVTAQKTNAPLADAVVTVAAADGAPLAVFKAAEAPPPLLLLPGRFRVTAELGLVRAEKIINIAEGRLTPVDMALNVGRLQLAAGARDGLAPLEAALFLVEEEDPPRGRREVARSAASQAEFALPPGVYYVTARQGSVLARERIEIVSGDVVRRTLTAAAGRLSLSTGGLSPVAAAGNLISYSIRRLDDPDQETVTITQPAPSVFLPVGRYRVEGRYGATNVVATRDVEIKAGQTLQLPIEHQAATLRLRFAGTVGASADVLWGLRDEAGRVVWSSGQAEPAAVVLQAGRYLVTADTGEKHEERAVELRAGDAKLVEITGG